MAVPTPCCALPDGSCGRGMARVHCLSPLGNDRPLLLESRVIQRLSTDLGMLSLTNTHTSAETAHCGSRKLLSRCRQQCSSPTRSLDTYTG